MASSSSFSFMSPVITSMSPMSPVSPFSPVSSISSLSPINYTSSPVVVTPPRNTLIYTPQATYTTYNNSNSPVSNAPVIPTLNLSYSRPILSSYENLNIDPRIHHRLSKFFRFKVLDNWLYDDLSKLLGYIKISNGNPRIIKNMDEYKDDENESDKKTKKIKIEYIEKYVLSVDVVYKILLKFTESTNTTWVDLPKNEYFVKQTLEIGIRKQFKRLMSQ